MDQPLLRTLAPALRELEKRLRVFLGAKHRYPLTTLQRATLDGLAGDLDRQSAALQMEQPLLVIMLMGGTGVGKSTLLNALAGGAIANASFHRPTTRDPVVYYHHSIQTTKLDPALQHCKLASHDRPNLEHKILVDTPDLDSNDLANRDKLMRLLPVADIVLYVGSQEKYHDKLGWELFMEQRQRRAFAFVLNKWDRCLHPGAVGMRPDEDLLRDLKAEGFEKPMLFRTCAQHWVDHPYEGNGQVPVPVEGEQFRDLVQWLELGLTRMEIEAIKARGVSRLLAQLEETVGAICPPDLTQAAERIRGAWSRQLGDEANAAASVLLNTLDPYQKEIEHHFAAERQKRFSGIMSWYLQAFNKLRYTGSTLRDQLPFAMRGSSIKTPDSWNLTRFAEACSDAASEQHLSSRLKAMNNRLLVEADTLGIPLGLLSEPTEELTRIDWRKRFAETMINVITKVEQDWSHPSGPRMVLQRGIILAADWLPGIAFLATGAVLLWRIFLEGYEPHWSILFSPLVVTLLVLILLHVFVALFAPIHWPTIRSGLHEHLETKLREELETHYHQVLTEVTQEVLVERRQNEAFQKEITEVAKWLADREQAASIVNLYGR